MDFRDGRSMKVVCVPHCELNQNARLARCAERPAAVTEIVAGLMQRQIGVIQMPCPELMVIGLAREHVNIRSALESRPARAALRAMARDLVYQVRQYLACGVRVLGVRNSLRNWPSRASTCPSPAAWTPSRTRCWPSWTPGTAREAGGRGPQPS